MNQYRTRAANILHAKKTCLGASVKELASQCNVSKSVFYWHRQAQAKRVERMGFDFFETRAGQEWLYSLYHAILLVFCLHSGVGGETLSFFSLVNLNLYVRNSPDGIRKVKCNGKACGFAFPALRINDGHFA